MIDHCRECQERWGQRGWNATKIFCFLSLLHHYLLAKKLWLLSGYKTKEHAVIGLLGCAISTVKSKWTLRLLLRFEKNTIIKNVPQIIYIYIYKLPNLGKGDEPAGRFWSFSCKEVYHTFSRSLNDTTVFPFWAHPANKSATAASVGGELRQFCDCVTTSEVWDSDPHTDGI